MSSSAGGGNLNPNPWTPYESYRDCSQGICSIYCPQWCYIMFPPPPPSFNMYDDDDSSTNFSPLLIALIGVLATAFLIVSYYTLISRFCRRGGDGSASRDAAGRIHSVADAWIPPGGSRNPPAVAGLDEALIKSIAVYKYKKEDGVVNCVDCSVCLSEFEENESLRLLPECTHAFHVPCIDTWLKSHSNCPICRASIAAASTGSDPPVTVATNSNGINRTSEMSVSAMEYQQRSDDSVVVIMDLESGARDEAVVTIPIRDGDASTAKPPEREYTVKDTEETSMRMGRQVQICPR